MSSDDDASHGKRSEDDESSEQEEELQNNSEEEEPQDSRRKRKQQHRFIPATNILFLLALNAHKPWAAGHGFVTKSWEKVASEYNSAISKPGAIDCERARRHWGVLLGKFKQDEMASLRASGTEEQYDEQEQLLTELATNYNDFQEKTKALSEKERQKKEKEELQAAEIREAALKNMKPRSKPKTSRKASSPSLSKDSSFLIDDIDDLSEATPEPQPASTESKKRRRSSAKSEEISAIKEDIKKSDALSEALISSIQKNREEDIRLKREEFEHRRDMDLRRMELEEKKLAEQTALRLGRERERKRARRRYPGAERDNQVEYENSEDEEI